MCVCVYVCAAVTSVVSDSVWPCRQQPTRLPRLWDSPGKNTGVGCHFLLQCMKVKSENEVSLLATPWTAAYQAPPSMGFSRQEYWSGVPLPSPRHFFRGHLNLGSKFPSYMEKAMAPHSSSLAWKIPWMEEPGGLQSMGSLRVGYNWATSLSLFTFIHWRRKWQPTPVFLPGKSHGRRSLVGCGPWGC